MRKQRFRFDENTLRLLLLQHKDYLLPFGIIFAAIGLFFVLIIPQFKEYGQMRADEALTAKRIKAIHENSIFLAKIDQNTLDSQFQSVSAALPIEKDFAAILNTIARTSEKSGVSVNDFAFNVGEVSTPSAKSNTRAFLQVDLTLKGGVPDMEKFLDALTTSLPVSEALSVRASSGLIGIKKVYYYKPYARLPYSDDVVLHPLTASQQTILNQIASWK